MYTAPWGRRENFSWASSTNLPPQCVHAGIAYRILSGSASVRKSQPCSYVWGSTKTRSNNIEKVKLLPSEEAVQYNASNMKRIGLVPSFRTSTWQAVITITSHYSQSWDHWVISKVNTHSSVMAQNGVSPWVRCTVIMVFTSWSTLAVFSSLFLW